MENIDLFIVVGFLTITLFVGLYKSRGITTISDYALGGRNFSTSEIVSTLIATWISGSLFTLGISESYSKGTLFILINIFGNLAAFLSIAYFIAPRMQQMLGSISIASAMGKLYGEKARIITALSGIIGVTGYVAVQLKVISYILGNLTGIDQYTVLVCVALIVTLYSTYGGIKAVTITDVVQFILFASVVPFILVVMWGSISDVNDILIVLNSDTIFNPGQLFNHSSIVLEDCLNSLFFIAVPWITPTIFQRISMSRDVKQVKNSFIVSGIFCTIFNVVISWLAIVIYTVEPDLKINKIVPFIFDHYLFAGIRGLAVASVIAMVMSTIDSFINSSSVLFANDLCKSLKLKTKAVVFVSRIFAIFIGIFSFLLAMKYDNVVSIILASASFYGPIITPPLLMAIFGYKINSRVVLSNMALSFVIVVLWRSFAMDYTNIDSIIPGFIIHSIMLLSYCILSPKDTSNYIGKNNKVRILKQKRLNNQLVINTLVVRNFFSRVKLNTPLNQSYFPLIGMFCVIFLFSTMYTIPLQIRDSHDHLFKFLYYSIIIFSNMFLTYPLWPKKFRSKKISTILWYLGMWYPLTFASCLIVLLSEFSQLQLMMFILSIVIVSIMMTWQAALLIITSGVLSSVFFIVWYVGEVNIAGNLNHLQFKIIYMLLLISSILIAFLKPKQEYVEATEAKVDYLSETNMELIHKIDDYSDKLTLQEKEIARLGETAQRILNNVNHELRLPVGNVMNFAEMLSEGLGKYSEEQLKELSDEVVQNTNRLSSMILNMLDLATLDAKKIELSMRTTNLSGLVEERAKHCFKLYKDNKQLQFKLDIEPEILVKVDPNYIRQTVDNLVINAIRYSCQGTITVTLRKNKDHIIFTITDEGLGIPANELLTIFEPFQQSSKTTSKAEGRGVGLALCKAAVEAHGGVISAESDGNGARFRFALISH